MHAGKDLRKNYSMYGLVIDQPLGYVTHILQIYWIYKDAIDLTVTSRGQVHLKLLFFFKMKCERCIIISWCWSQIPSIIMGGFTSYNPAKFGIIKKSTKSNLSL